MARIVDTFELYVGPPCPLRYFDTPISAGFPSPAADYVEGRIDLNELLVKRPAATFLVQISGNSMVGAGIHDGDLAVVDRSLRAVSGSIVVAVLDGYLTVKRLRLEPGRVVLMAEHPDYPPIEIRDGQQFEIWGCLTATIHYPK